MNDDELNKHQRRDGVIFISSAIFFLVSSAILRWFIANGSQIASKVLYGLRGVFVVTAIAFALEVKIFADKQNMNFSTKRFLFYLFSGAILWQGAAVTVLHYPATEIYFVKLGLILLSVFWCLTMNAAWHTGNLHFFGGVNRNKQPTLFAFAMLVCLFGLFVQLYFICKPIH